MGLLGSRLRQRRKQMGLRQRDIAGVDRVSFLSKVERGASRPSLKSLEDWSLELKSTAADLIGDHLVLEAAKESILLTEKCHAYLRRLPATSLTSFLRDLSASASALSIPVPQPPPDPDLAYLTAKVLLHRGMTRDAQEIVEKWLSSPCPPLARIRHLSLLCLIYRELAESGKEQEAQDALRRTLLELDHQELLDTLPDACSLTASDLELLKVSALVRKGNLL